jgi:acetoacetyl-CoA synthetase
MSMPVRDGDLLWTPSEEWIAGTNLAAFISWLAAERGRDFDDYQALWRWSVDDLAGFWQAIWDYSRVEASVPPQQVLSRRAMPGAEWFPGAMLNYAQHVLRHERPGEDALLYASESTPVTGMDWAELAGQVRVLGTRLRDMGVRPGDRVASYMPNIPQAVIAMLATTSSASSARRCSFAWTDTATAAGATIAAPSCARSSRALTGSPTSSTSRTAIVRRPRPTWPRRSLPERR